MARLLSVSPVELQTVEERVLRILREAIIRGEIAPGSSIRVEEVAASLGVSKTPVKQALKGLANEGFVALSPYRTAVVSDLSADDAEEIYIMRIGLEALATRVGVERLTPEALTTMQELCQRLDTLTDDAQLFLNVDIDLHMALYRCTGRKSLVQRIFSLRNSSMRYIMTLIHVFPGHLQGAQQVHYDLLRACEGRRAAEASALIAGDLQYASERMVAYLRAHREPKPAPAGNDMSG
jgi:DNA-binding GntR family transcriptional regulator